jgi:hypothetical protein
MGTFTGSLRAIGDVKALPATIELEGGRLSIASGETEIGSWELKEIDLEPIPTGYRMAAEGDQILIELEDVHSFSEALEMGKKRRLLARNRKSSAQTRPEPKPIETPATPRPVETPARVTSPSQPTRSRNVALPPAQSSPAPEKEKKTSSGRGVVDFVDGMLVRAQKRFGPYLPDWVFTRIMFAGILTALVLVIVLPGLVSVLLLVGGLLLVLFGAVVYTDPMLASRLLPGRTAPQHALLFGVLTLVVGVLLGVVAR